MKRNSRHILAMLFLLCSIPPIANSQWVAGNQQGELMRSACRDAFSSKVIAPAAPAESRLTSLRAFLKTESGDWRDNTDRMHSPRFGSPLTVDAVVCISESEKDTGEKYTDRSSAYSLTWEVKIVGWPQRHLVYSTTLISNPPVSKVGFGGKAGEPPIQRLVQHIVALTADRNILSSLRARIEPEDSHTDYSVRSIALSADGKWLAAASDSGHILLWDLVTRTLVRVLDDDFSVSDVFAISFSRDARFLAVSGLALGDKTVRLVEVSTGRVLRKLDLGPDPAGVAALSFVDHDKILTGFSHATMYQWAVHSGRQVATAAVDRPKAENGSGFLISNCEAMSMDGGTFAVAWEDGTVTVYEGPKHTMKVLAQHLGGVRALAFSPDGNTLASAGGDDGTIRLWRVASGSALGAAFLLEHLWSMAFAPSGKMLAVGTIDRVVLLDPTLGNEVGHFESEGGVSTVQFSPDGNAVLAGGEDGAVRIWQTPLVSELKVQNSRNEDGRVTNWRKGALFVVVRMVALLVLVGVALLVFLVSKRLLSR